MFGKKKLRTSNAVARKAITTGREATEVAREAIELYQNARRSEEAVLGIVEGAVATEDLGHIQSTVRQLREEHDKYRSREDAIDAAHRVGWRL